VQLTTGQWVLGSNELPNYYFEIERSAMSSKWSMAVSNCIIGPWFTLTGRRIYHAAYYFVLKHH